jgi:surface antigen
MRKLGVGATAMLFGATLAAGTSISSSSANAADQKTAAFPTPHVYTLPSYRPTYSPRNGAAHLAASHARRFASRSYGGISCVPYARAVSGIQVVGNAWQWWSRAAGVYARGNRPEVGAVLNFRSNARMPLGHVAVVDQIVNAREIRIQHANWPLNGLSGRISSGVTVVDVSEANNWSAVRVELGRSADFGSVYPTYGFIYKRPDTGVMVANNTPPAPQPNINPVPSDLRPRAERPWHTSVEEVAQAPDHPNQLVGVTQVATQSHD